MRNVSIGVAGVVVLLILLSPASAEWNQQTLLESDTYMQVFGVSDDGSRIVYIADTDGNRATVWDWEVFLMDLNTGEITRITRNVDQEVQAGISGDGNVIVYGTMTNVGGETVVKYYEVRGDEGWQTPRPLMDRNSVFTADSPASNGHMYVPIAINYDGRGAIVPAYKDFGHGAEPGICMFYQRSFIGWNADWHHPKSRGSYFVTGQIHSDYRDRLSSIRIGPSRFDRWQPVFTANPDEVILSSTMQSFSVSSDGKVAFRIGSAEEGARKGIFLYDGRNIYQISQNTAVTLTISGDGTKVFYLHETYNGVTPNIQRMHVVNSDGSNDVEVGYIPLSPYYRAIFTNNDGSKLFVLRGYSLILYTPPELTTTYDRIRGINPNIQSSWLANSGVFIPPSTTIEFGSAEGTPGSEVQIPVTIRNAENIGAINLVLNYPTDVLEFEELLAGSLTQNSMIEHNVQGENISVGIVDTEGISGVGSLFYLKFRVIGEPKKVNVPVEGIESGKKGKTQTESLTQALTERAANSTLAILEAIVNDVDGNDVEVVTIKGNFNLISEEEAKRGDVNGDGEVNSLDALLALQMSVGKLEPNMIADMNDDGKVLASDALEIMKIATENMVSKTFQIVQQGIRQPAFGKG